ncbi:MAG: Protein involved in biosynthesis of mitomycin antibiotics/polyketide fumonisin [Acidimicrobiales bacterium]|nr:Protein involved in biosynthesis of mitomycin antibiotics/polyketide fumonisin [Acidimicrobiales bacterium]
MTGEGLDEVDFDAICGPVAPHEATGGPMRVTFRDPDHQAHLDLHGYAVVPLLDADGLRDVRAVLDAVGPAPGDERTGWFAGNGSTSIEWKHTVIERVRPLVADRVAELFDDHHIFNITFMTKWVGPDGEVIPHLDPTMVDHEGTNRGISVWCPLNGPAGGGHPDRGWVRVVPGSHRLATGGWYRARGAGRPSGFDEAEEEIYRRLAVMVPIGPGEAIALDHRVIHCSPPNLTDEPRLVAALGVRPAEVPSIHVECDDDGSVSFYAVDDAYFTEAWRPATSYPLLRRTRRLPPPTVTLADVEGLVGGAAGPEAQPAPVPRRGLRRLLGLGSSRA